jgi:protein-ribulosamine 3-kinase
MTSIQQYISTLLNTDSAVFMSVGGGSINQAWQVTANGQKFFCKVNDSKQYPGLFEKEANGLKALRQANCIQTPAVIGVHYKYEQQLLLLQWVEKDSRRTDAFWKRFGRELAALHSWKGGQAMPGFEEDNYMGALPQYNSPMDNWCDFFRERRLKPQADLAKRRQLLPVPLLSSLDNLYKKLPDIFPAEDTSLLHGDLWSGNFLCGEAGTPVLVDPAVYYGHRSMDLAMTTLFGGFDKRFYEAYAHWHPLPANHAEQWEVCNLYPLLIHLNLFGQGYLSSIAAALHRFR